MIIAKRHVVAALVLLFAINSCGNDDVIDSRDTSTPTTAVLADRDEAIRYVRGTVDALAEAIAENTAHDPPDTEGSCTQGFEVQEPILDWEYNRVFELTEDIGEKEVLDRGRNFLEDLGFTVELRRDEPLVDLIAGGNDEGTKPRFVLTVNADLKRAWITGSTGCWPA